MSEWYQCEWCEGDGGWHAEKKPHYADPSKYVKALSVLRESIVELEADGGLVDGGDLRGWIALIDAAMSKEE